MFTQCGKSRTTTLLALLCLALVTGAGTAVAQLPMPSSTQFDVNGFLQNATVNNPADAHSGGTLTVNGHCPTYAAALIRRGRRTRSAVSSHRRSYNSIARNSTFRGFPRASAAKKLVASDRVSLIHAGCDSPWCPTALTSAVLLRCSPVLNFGEKLPDSMRGNRRLSRFARTKIFQSRPGFMTQS